MRRLGYIFGRRRRSVAPLELTASDKRSERDNTANTGTLGGSHDLERLSQEIACVGDYVARLKREIGALRPGELHQDRLPRARRDLTSVKDATQSAADTIMAAAETVLGADPNRADAYRATVEQALMNIIQACSFQDIAGQHLTRAMSDLSTIERRIERFSKAVRIADSTDRFDRESIVREARQEVLLVEGPQTSGTGIGQDAVDQLFD